MEVLDINRIIFRLLSILCHESGFAVLEFQREDHVSDQQYYVNSLAETDDIVFKDDVARHLAFIQSALKFGDLIFPCVGLIFTYLKRMPYKGTDYIVRVIPDKARNGIPVIRFTVLR